MLTALDTHRVVEQNKSGIICDIREHIDHFSLGLRVAHTYKNVDACAPSLPKFVSATGLYSKTIALVCHISGHCSPCKGPNQAYQGMGKSPLQRCDNSKELNYT